MDHDHNHDHNHNQDHAPVHPEYFYTVRNGWLTVGLSWETRNPGIYSISRGVELLIYVVSYSNNRLLRPRQAATSIVKAPPATKPSSDFPRDWAQVMPNVITCLDVYTIGSRHTMFLMRFWLLFPCIPTSDCDGTKDSQGVPQYRSYCHSPRLIKPIRRKRAARDRNGHGIHIK